MNNGIVIHGNQVVSKDCDNLWAGLFSVVNPDGPIIKFIVSHLPPDITLAIPRCDGALLLKNDEYFEDNKGNQYHIKPVIQIKNPKFILGTLAQFTEDPAINYLYLPLDDRTFEYGITSILPQNTTPWNQRSSELCWVGSCSGKCNNVTGPDDWLGPDDWSGDSLRVRFVKMLYQNNPKVRLSQWWSENQNIPHELFGNRVDYTEFLKYKIFFIVDGAVIASNHQWGFASGCVPFVISNAKCWFLQFARPFIDYIPIKHDLSNLIQQIEWVKNNDTEAGKIANNALLFSKKYFSSEFQKEYLLKCLNI